MTDDPRFLLGLGLFGIVYLVALLDAIWNRRFSAILLLALPVSVYALAAAPLATIIVSCFLAWFFGKMADRK